MNNVNTSSIRYKLLRKLGLTKRFQSDKLSLFLVFASLAVLAWIVAILAISVRPQSFSIPLRYSSELDFTSRGHWQWLYLSASIGVIIITVNTLIAAKISEAHHRFLGRSIMLITLIQLALLAIVTNSLVSNT